MDKDHNNDDVVGKDNKVDKDDEVDKKDKVDKDDEDNKEEEEEFFFAKILYQPAKFGEAMPMGTS